MKDLFVEDILASIVTGLPFSDGQDYVSKILDKIEKVTSSLGVKGDLA